VKRAKECPEGWEPVLRFKHEVSGPHDPAADAQRRLDAAKARWAAAVEAERAARWEKVLALREVMRARRAVDEEKLAGLVHPPGPG
jgi:hypothetical protein